MLYIWRPRKVQIGELQTRIGFCICAKCSTNCVKCVPRKKKISQNKTKNEQTKRKEKNKPSCQAFHFASVRESSTMSAIKVNEVTVKLVLTHSSNSFLILLQVIFFILRYKCIPFNLLLFFAVVYFSIVSPHILVNHVSDQLYYSYFDTLKYFQR